MQRAGTLLFAVTWWIICSLLLAGLALAQDTPSASQSQYDGNGCILLTQLQGNTSKETEAFGVGATTLRVVYTTQPTNNRGFNSTDIAVVDADNFTQVDSVEAVEGEGGVLEVPLEPGRYFVDASTFEQRYEIVVEARGGDEPCTPAPQAEDDPDDAPDDGTDDTPNDVLAGTTPNKPLPNTGGPPLLALAALGLASTAVGASVLRAGLRHED